MMVITLCLFVPILSLLVYIRCKQMCHVWEVMLVHVHVAETNNKRIYYTLQNGGGAGVNSLTKQNNLREHTYNVYH